MVKGCTEGDLIEKSDWVLSQFGVMQRGEKIKNEFARKSEKSME